MKNKFKREPVTLAGTTVLFLESILATLVATDIISLNTEQIVSINNLLIAGASLASLVIPLYLARNRVTPIAAPMIDGVEAVVIKK